jgi:hypothetical protein
MRGSLYFWWFRVARTVQPQVEKSGEGVRVASLWSVMINESRIWRHFLSLLSLADNIAFSVRIFYMACI